MYTHLSEERASLHSFLPKSKALLSCCFSAASAYDLVQTRWRRMTDCGSTMSPLKHFKFPSGPLGAGNNCFSGHLFSCVEDSSPKRIQARSQFYFKAHTHIYGHACTEMHTRRHTRRHTHTNGHVCTEMHTRRHTHTQIYGHACTEMLTHRHTHIYGHACTEMHTRRHTQASPERAAAWPPPAWMSVPVLSPQGGAPAQPWLPRAPV